MWLRRKKEIPPESASKGWSSEQDLMDLVEDNFPFEECKIPPGKMLLMQDARPCILWRVVATVDSGTSLPMRSMSSSNQ